MIKRQYLILGLGFCICFLLGNATVCAQEGQQGIGLRVGDPLGLTYKYYLPRKMAMEVNLGTAPRSWYSAYFKDSFDDRKKYDDFRYVSHSVKSTFALQGRYLWHYAFPANVEGRLDWYWGLGAQMRLVGVEYSYFDNEDIINELTIIRELKRTDFDIGPEGIIGVEYELQDFPIVTFGEASLLTELADKPFRFRVFAALGVRYSF